MPASGLQALICITSLDMVDIKSDLKRRKTQTVDLYKITYLYFI